jgi:hypothetical protein
MVDALFFPDRDVPVFKPFFSAFTDLFLAMG